MLMLRLARAGSKKRPVYHLVAADRRSRRDGRFIENLGYYMPTRDILVLKMDRIEHWQSVGAQATDTARGLINRARRHGNSEPVAPARRTPAKTTEPSTETKTKDASARPEPAAKKGAADSKPAATADSGAPSGESASTPETGTSSASAPQT